MNVAILDDWFDTLRTLPCFAQLDGHRLTVFTDHVTDTVVLAERLADFDALVLIRERTPIQAPLLERFGAKALRWFNRPWPATLMFFAIMALVFQAVFSWATPLMDAIDAGASGLSDLIAGLLPASAFASFLTDGVIAVPPLRMIHA